MKKVVRYVLLAVFLLGMPVFSVFAHPGRTDSSGCHTCKTNCEQYGLSYGEYHCHNGSSSSGSSSSSSGSSSRSYNITTRVTTTKRVYGCTSKEAINYNASANASDRSCQFEKIDTKTEIINYETVVQGNKKSGNEKILVKGETGEKEITIKTITNESGEQISSEVVSEKITKPPVSQVVMYETTTTKVETEVSTDEESDNSSIIVMLILFIFSVIFGKKHTDAKLIINWIRKNKKLIRYILYFLYFIFIIPIFIDIVLIIIYITKNKK